jgi:hypothetical protein
MKDVQVTGEASGRRKIRLIEGNAKCRHLKILTFKGTLRQVFICLRPKPHTPAPLTHFILVYSILIHIGKGGGRIQPERRLEVQQITKLGRKYQHD